MAHSNSSPRLPTERMASYRARMRADGLRPVQLWVPDTRAPEFVEICHGQALAIAANDPGGDEIMEFVESAYEWPEE